MTIHVISIDHLFKKWEMYNSQRYHLNPKKNNFRIYFLNKFQQNFFCGPPLNKPQSHHSKFHLKPRKYRNRYKYEMLSSIIKSNE